MGGPLQDSQNSIEPYSAGKSIKRRESIIGGFEQASPMLTTYAGVDIPPGLLTASLVVGA